jgi:hypothetical protein
MINLVQIHNPLVLAVKYYSHQDVLLRNQHNILLEMEEYTVMWRVTEQKRR